MTRRAIVAATAILLLAGCPDEADRAAKKRIFSPEEPPKAKLAASQPIDAGKIADDPALTWRVLTMGASEAFERIGPFRYSATASWEWTLAGDSVSLIEKRQLDQASAHEYAVHTENNRDGGLDLIRVGDQTYARKRYHKYRERKRDRGQSDFIRDDVFGALHSAQTLLGNRLALVRDRQEELGGRTVRRFGLAIAEKELQPVDAAASRLPEIQYPAGGPDPSTRRRVDFARTRSPRSVEGSVWVDVETGVPLKAEILATVAAPGADSKEEAKLVLKIRSELKPSSKVAVVAPEEFLPDEGRPNGIAAALERFEIQRPDGGTPPGERPSRPPESDDAAEE